MSEAEQLRDLFGSESEEEDVGPDAQTRTDAGPSDSATANNAASARDLFGSDEEEEGEPARGARAGSESDEGEGLNGDADRPRGPPLLVEAPLCLPLPGEGLRLVRLANLLSIDPRPFDPDTYGDEGEAGSSAAWETTVHWRWASTPQGAIQRQSNARFVRWSDGSLQLLLGADALDVREIDIAGEHSFVFARHQALIQGQSALDRKLVFHPASLRSRFHRRLAAALDGQGMRSTKVRATTTLADPAKLKRERELLEEQRIRDRERLMDKQQKQTRVYAPRAKVLSSAYLEEDEEDDVFGDGDEDSDREGASNQYRRGYDPDEDARAEERLAQAKTAAPPPAPGGGKRRRAIEDSEDEAAEDEVARGKDVRRRTVLLEESDEEEMF